MHEQIFLVTQILNHPTTKVTLTGTRQIMAERLSLGHRQA